MVKFLSFNVAIFETFNMKKIMFKNYLKLFLLTLILSILIPNFANAQNKVDIILFYGNGCLHCNQAISFLDNLKKEYTYINVQKYEVYSNQENRELFQKIANANNISIEKVPTIFIDKDIIVGFDKKQSEKIKQIVETCANNQCVSPIDSLSTLQNQKLENSTVTQSKDAYCEEGSESAYCAPPEDKTPKTNFMEKLTIPAVISAALIDSVNPCEFAVLVLLLTTILSSKERRESPLYRRRSLYYGLAFTLAIFISYFLMGLGIYSAIQISSFTQIFYTAIAILALFIGLLNIKDYFWYGKGGILMEVPPSWRPKLQSVIKGVTSIPGAFFIGFLVSLFLLPCTSGPYIVILGLLTHVDTKLYALGLLFFYNLIFIVPMILITVAVYLGLLTTGRIETWRKKQLRMFHLITGIAIFLLGVLMILSVIYPDLFNFL